MEPGEVKYKWYVNGVCVGEGKKSPHIEDDQEVTLHMITTHGTFVTNAVEVNTKEER